MSVMSIDFDVEKLIGRLNIIEKTQIPFAANQALKEVGFKLAKQILPVEFTKEFNAPDGFGTPVPRTLNAFLYNADGMELKIYPKEYKSQAKSPNEYLYSALYGGQATDTVLHTVIKRMTNRYPVPAHQNLMALGAYNQYGDIKGSYAGKVISGIEGNLVRKSQPKAGERFVATGPSDMGGLKGNRIYRLKTGATPISIFTLFDRKKSYKPIIPYESFVAKKAEQLLKPLLRKHLDRAMASR